MVRNVILVLMVTALSFGWAFMGGCNSTGSKANVQNQIQINTTTVKVTNSNGSIFQVPLRQEGPGWLGPRGEYYEQLPTEDQLKPIYGF
jgi:hypothetical protein